MNYLQTKIRKNIYKMEVEKNVFKIRGRNRRWHVVQKVTKHLTHHVNKKPAEWIQGVGTEAGHEIISANKVNREVSYKLLNDILSCRIKYLEVVNWVTVKQQHKIINEGSHFQLCKKDILIRTNFVTLLNKLYGDNCHHCIPIDLDGDTEHLDEGNIHKI